jgi:hypothetical protein
MKLSTRNNLAEAKIWKQVGKNSMKRLFDLIVDGDSGVSPAATIPRRATNTTRRFMLLSHPKTYEKLCPSGSRIYYLLPLPYTRAHIMK